jgi:translation initiation factor 3 subunit M
MRGLVGAVEAATGNVENIVESKIEMLCALYNLRSGSEKCWILARILNLAAFSGNEASLMTLLPGRKSTLGKLLEGNNLERLLAGFDSNDEDKRALYSVATKVVAKVAQVCKEKDLDKEASAADSAKQRFLLKILATYSSTSESNDETRSAAKQAAIGAICDPVTLFYEQRIIMSLPPVADLKNTDKEIYALLEIFQQGKLEDFQSFIQSNPNTLSNNNISEEDAIRHMRLLSLCSLATEHEEIPYDAIATTLQVDQSAVENWVIDAVSSGLLSAKMDQLQHVVMVERCVVRRFGIEQWKILQDRLNVWKTNVKSVLDGLKQTQV